jgi:hypothetical protein
MGEIEHSHLVKPIIGSTRAERTAAREDQMQQQVDDLREKRLDTGGREAAEEVARTVRGESVFHWIPVIEQLKRQGRLGEALELAWECMEVAETALLFGGAVPPPGWVTKVAVIARKLDRADLEVEVLERWFAHLPATSTETSYPDLRHRLTVARARLAP